MLKAARTTALVIVPLAAAVSAQAGSVALPSSGNPTCAVSGGSGGFCFSGDAQLTDLGSGVQGLSFFTSGGFTQNLFVSSSGSSADISMGMGDSGVLGGTIANGTAIPVSWAFNMTPLSGLGVINSWSLTFALGSLAGTADYGFASTSGGSIGSSGATIVGGPINLLVSQDILSGSTLFETVKLTINASTDVGVQVTVPQGTTWDFNSVASAAVPEPASVGMIGAGLAFLGALVRRRRK
jgi:hypothetical protein